MHLVEPEIPFVLLKALLLGSDSLEDDDNLLPIKVSGSCIRPPKPLLENDFSFLLEVNIFFM